VLGAGAIWAIGVVAAMAELIALGLNAAIARRT